MESHLSEFLFGEIVLLLASSLLALVGYLLKRHIHTTDTLREKVEKLSDQVGRLLERDRMRRLGDYAPESHNTSVGD